MPKALKAIWEGWKRFTEKLGIVMTFIMMTVMFIVILPVFSLVRFSDPLRRKRHSGGTYWEEHKPYESTLDRAKRAF